MLFTDVYDIDNQKWYEINGKYLDKWEFNILPSSAVTCLCNLNKNEFLNQIIGEFHF